jgi:hypothetical protein
VSEMYQILWCISCDYLLSLVDLQALLQLLQYVHGADAHAHIAARLNVCVPR